MALDRRVAISLAVAGAKRGPAIRRAGTEHDPRAGPDRADRIRRITAKAARIDQRQIGEQHHRRKPLPQTAFRSSSTSLVQSRS